MTPYTIRLYTIGRGHVAVVRKDGRGVWRSQTVPYGSGGLARAMAEQWIGGGR